MSTKELEAGLTDAQIEARLAFADKILAQLAQHGKRAELPPHLELERARLMAEKLARLQGVDGSEI